MGSLQWIFGIGLGVITWVFATNAINQYRQQHSARSRFKEDDYIQSPSENCPICLEEMNSGNMQYLVCCHALHEKCLKELKKQSSGCPICREPIL